MLTECQHDLQNGWTALLTAAKEGRLAVVQALLADSRVDVNAQSEVLPILRVLVFDL